MRDPLFGSFMSATDAAEKAYELIRAIPRDGRGNPLTLEGTIRSVILKHPGMFKYRDDVLGILYCVLGTGIRWLGGRLGDVNPNGYTNPPPEAGGQGVWSLDHGFDDSLKSMGAAGEAMRERLKQRHAGELQAAIETIESIDERCQQLRPDGKSWYPISWYACNLCAPEGAQADFRDGAIETATLIVNATPEPGTQRWLIHQRTKRVAGEILSVLLARPTGDSPPIADATAVTVP